MNTSKKIVINGLVAGLYAAITILLSDFAFGPFQIRPAEALTVLPLLLPYTWIGLTIGCAIANLFSVAGWIDVIFGSMLTLIAALITMYVGKKFKKTYLKLILGLASPILINAFGLPIMFYLSKLFPTYSIAVALSLLLSETLNVCVFGIPLYFVVEKRIKEKMLV